jgi:hypothetical protein
MARDFWSQVPAGQRLEVRLLSPVVVPNAPVSTAVLETFWRRHSW